MSHGRDGQGKRRDVSETTHGTKRQAQARLNELLTSKSRGTLGVRSTQTVGEYLSAWLETAARPSVPSRTWADDTRVMETYITRGGAGLSLEHDRPPVLGEDQGVLAGSHQDQLVIHRLKTNQPLPPADLEGLQVALVETGEGDGEELLERPHTRKEAPSLAHFVPRLVGMDRAVAQAMFSIFLSDRSLSGPQTRFVEMVIDRVTARGVMEGSALYEPPFSGLHREGPDSLFAGKEQVIEGIFERLKLVEAGLDAEAGEPGRLDQMGKARFRQGEWRCSRQPLTLLRTYSSRRCFAARGAPLGRLSGRSSPPHTDHASLISFVENRSLPPPGDDVRLPYVAALYTRDPRRHRATDENPPQLRFGTVDGAHGSTAGRGLGLCGRGEPRHHDLDTRLRRGVHRAGGFRRRTNGVGRRGRHRDGHRPPLPRCVRERRRVVLKLLRPYADESAPVRDPGAGASPPTSDTTSPSERQASASGVATVCQPVPRQTTSA